MKEKLIELLKDTRANAAWHHWGCEESADYLIANGVTLDNQVSSSKWISVKDRLPEAFKLVLVYRATGCEVENCINVEKGIWHDDNISDYPVTHWMPLPEPPEGE